mmetsp:Transcript_5027/g.16047  ORF Transcript_5027/g.16047 Transcript_5027/m.16047 type:complete len:95 (-) Transcript_5027:273-557(-)
MRWHASLTVQQAGAKQEKVLVWNVAHHADPSLVSSILYSPPLKIDQPCPMDPSLQIVLPCLSKVQKAGEGGWAPHECPSSMTGQASSTANPSLS